jgi:N-acyl homoserine lactone hydrolase
MTSGSPSSQHCLLFLAGLLLVITPVGRVTASAQNAPATPQGRGGPASVPNPGPGKVQRLWDIDCGQIHSTEMSRWMDGINVNKEVDLSVNCYLIQHDRGLFLWDTGISDANSRMPAGQPNGTMNFRRSKTLLSQLAEIGVTPAQIAYVAFSHSHPDHTGNAMLFPSSTVIIQQAEYDAAMAPPQDPSAPATALHERLRSSLVRRISGDYDVFGDGSIMLLSTPGHTPGHQAALVRLPKRGNVILSGDAVHFQTNWDNMRVPGFNFNKEQSLASMQRIKAVMEREHAELWINHEKTQTDRMPKAPTAIE